MYNRRIHNYAYIHTMNLAAQSTSSYDSTHHKKISTTSFGSAFTGGDYLSTTLERLSKNNPEAAGRCLK